ncbi:MAG TPA: GNAT family N-acetyltransferase [Caldilineaceae bacterium]|nr:GNAT family N-acetyltransferase [Caldilineaceae bacterium]
MSSVRITTIAPAYFAGLETLQQICYPTLGTHELMTVAHFASQYRVFAEGQIVAVADLPDGNDLVVGQGSGFLIDFDFTRPDHRFSEICDGFYFTQHNANGAYYYGADISVHPDYRGQGIGSRIYRARKDLVKRLHRRGIVAGGLIPGYADHKSTLSVQAYVDRVVAGELFDPTLSFQLRSGFRVRGLIRDYIEDSASDNWATLIEWVNPEWEA